MQKARTHPIVRLQRLAPARRRLLVRATLVLSAASAAVALLPFRKAIRFGCVAPRGPRIDVADVVWAVEAAARRLPWRAMCIEQGLAVQRMLRRGEVDAVLHYGVRHDRATRALEAHVWITVNGTAVIGGKEAAGFARVASYP